MIFRIFLLAEAGTTASDAGLFGGRD